MGFVIVLDRVQGQYLLTFEAVEKPSGDGGPFERRQGGRDGEWKNNARIESPTSPHVAQRNLEEAAILYTVIKGDEMNMSD